MSGHTFLLNTEMEPGRWFHTTIATDKEAELACSIIKSLYLSRPYISVARSVQGISETTPLFTSYADSFAFPAPPRPCFDAVLTYRPHLDPLEITIQETPWAEPLCPGVVTYVFKPSLRLSQSARCMPVEYAAVPIRIGQEPAKSMTRDAVLYSLHGLTFSYNIAIGVCVLSTPNAAEGITAQMARDIICAWGIDPLKDYATRFVDIPGIGTVERASAPVSIAADDVRPWRVYLRRDDLRLNLPVFRRNATREYTVRRIAEVLDMGEKEVNQLAEIVPEILDNALLRARYLATVPAPPARATTPREVDAPTIVQATSRLGSWQHRTASLEFIGDKKRASGLRRYIGLEIEVAKTSRYVVANRAILDVNASAMGDGSIPSSGIEIVTQPTRGQAFRKYTTQLLKGLREAGTSTDNSCGLHVHVDARDLDTFGLQRLVRLWAKIEPAMYDLVAHSRKRNRYCKPATKEYANIAEANTSSALRQALNQTLYQQRATSRSTKQAIERFKSTKYMEARYFGLNLHSWFLRRTIEFRMHQGTVDYRKVIGWAEICAWVIQSAASLSDKQIAALPSVPTKALYSLLPRHLRAFAKRRSATLAKNRPGYVAPSRAPTATPAPEPVTVAPIVPTPVETAQYDAYADVPF